MSLEKTIINIISETLGVEKKQISPHSDFFNDLNADKVEIADIIFKIQQVCQIELMEKDITKIKTVADLINLAEANSDEL